ncbi:flagellar export chaperone FliS [Nesterenkonia lutea]|uniref:Flagellar protein FliS n=1 Tax=Nesterenkonia lutea TaxID=272919 RepID=A0ABR9JFD1_9MICC|nr:flagellar export chaperone FliS [Nesterenkonia lutea]MBE1524648.1 flagellar protein FliS [Nesterenkonia lutea]
MYENVTRARSQFNREAILSASPAKLLTMLYDRLLLDLGRAEAAQQQQRWQDASAELVHAQAILAELTSSLDTEVWEGGRELQALYAFATAELIAANTRRDPLKTRSIIEILEPLRATWHEAAETARAAEPVAASRGVLGVG